jgi:LysM repeat protein
MSNPIYGGFTNYNPARKMYYKIVGGSGGEWHDYTDGERIWVASPPPAVQPSGGVEAPAPVVPPVVASSTPQPVTGGTPAPAPTPPAPASAAPAPVPTNLPTATPVSPDPGYPHQDLIPGTKNYSDWYKDVSVPGGINHVYANGNTVFVPNHPTGVESTGGVPAPGFSNTPTAVAPATPNTSNTGGTAFPSSSSAPANPTPPDVTFQFGQQTTGSSSPSSDSGATYSVVHGDTLSGIAEKNGVSLSKLEALNPQIKNPSLIFPGEKVNLGGGSTVASSAPSVTTNNQVVNGGNGTGGTAPGNTLHHSGFYTTGGQAPATAPADIGFPSKSSYPFTAAGSEVGSAGSATVSNQQAQGWVNGTGSTPPDVAKQIFEADTHPGTDPLKIDDKK